MTKDSKPAFAFYDVVEVIGGRRNIASLVGRRGAVLGMAQSDDGQWSYAVQMLDDGDGWTIPEAELKATGEAMCREDFYDGSSIKVEVRPQSRKGTRSRWEPVVVGVLVLLVLIVSIPGAYYRWAFFVPEVWLAFARVWVWMGVAALIFGGLAVGSRRMERTREDFSRNSLLYLLGAALFGFLASQLFFGSAAVLGGRGSETVTQCYLLKSVDANPHGTVRTLEAAIALPGAGAERAVAVKYRSMIMDLSLLKAGDVFELQVQKGMFGARAVEWQRPRPGCGNR